MENQALLKLILFLSEQTLVKASKITESTRIGEDLGVDGDDAVELLLEYSRIFKVDLSEFKYDEYFGPEGCNPFLIPVYLLGMRKMKILTVGDLMGGILSGKLG